MTPEQAAAARFAREIVRTTRVALTLPRFQGRAGAEIVQLQEAERLLTFQLEAIDGRQQ